MNLSMSENGRWFVNQVLMGLLSDSINAQGFAHYC
jgi:hypothetical protein